MADTDSTDTDSKESLDLSRKELNTNRTSVSSVDASSSCENDTATVDIKTDECNGQQCSAKNEAIKTAVHAETVSSDLLQNTSVHDDEQTIDAEHNESDDTVVDGDDRTIDFDATLLDVALRTIPPVSYESCQVCGDVINTGIYLGALVCIACKKFFLRYPNDSTCKLAGACAIDIKTRKICKACRYKKCLSVGMCFEDKPTKTEPGKHQMSCAVCGDRSTGVHYGVSSCEGCKKFYQRGIMEHDTYSCKADSNCDINPRTRNICRSCRFAKCIAAGMAHSAILMGRPSRKRRYVEAP